MKKIEMINVLIKELGVSPQEMIEDWKEKGLLENSKSEKPSLGYEEAEKLGLGDACYERGILEKQEMRSEKRAPNTGETHPNRSLGKGHDYVDTDYDVGWY